MIYGALMKAVVNGFPQSDVWTVCVKARMDKRAKTLNNLYNINRDIILYGQDVDTFTFPSEIADIVQIIQQELMNTIRLKNLVI